MAVSLVLLMACNKPEQETSDGMGDEETGDGDGDGDGDEDNPETGDGDGDGDGDTMGFVPDEDRSLRTAPTATSVSPTPAWAAPGTPTNAWP